MKIQPGSKARVLCTDAPGDYPVVGYTEKFAEVSARNWTAGGMHVLGTDDNAFDLISEWREPVRVSGWCAVSLKGTVAGDQLFDTEDAAWEWVAARFVNGRDFTVIYVTGTEGVGPGGEG